MQVLPTSELHPLTYDQLAAHERMPWVLHDCAERMVGRMSLV